MSRVGAIGVYRPAWETHGLRVLGPDEDMITIAVAAGRAALSTTSEAARRVVLVTAEPDYLEGAPLPVLTRALGLASGIPAELRVGGAPAALEAVASSAPGVLVIGSRPAPEAAAGAALVAGSGMQVDDVATVANSVPMRVRRAGRDQASIYADGRVERERAWRPALRPLVQAVSSRSSLACRRRRPSGSAAGRMRTCRTERPVPSSPWLRPASSSTPDGSWRWTPPWAPPSRSPTRTPRG